jgi:hypothetical protein
LMVETESLIKGYRSSSFYGRIIAENSKVRGKPPLADLYVRTYLRGSYLYVSSQCTENM